MGDDRHDYLHFHYFPGLYQNMRAGPRLHYAEATSATVLAYFWPWYIALNSFRSPELLDDAFAHIFRAAAAFFSPPPRTPHAGHYKQASFRRRRLVMLLMRTTELSSLAAFSMLARYGRVSISLPPLLHIEFAT